MIISLDLFFRISLAIFLKVTENTAPWRCSCKVWLGSEVIEGFTVRLDLWSLPTAVSLPHTHAPRLPLPDVGLLVEMDLSTPCTSIAIIENRHRLKDWQMLCLAGLGFM